MSAAAAEVCHYSVSYYQPGKRGVWIARFDRVEDAEAFAAGKRCWGKPAVVTVEPGQRPK